MSNSITAIEAVKAATSLAGSDFIDKSFGIFRVEDDETSRLYQNLLKISCEEVMQDFFDRVDNQFQNVLSLTQPIKDNNGFFEYSLIGKNIYRILDVLNSTQRLTQIDSFPEFIRRSNAYMLDPFTLRTNVKYDNLTVTCLSSAIFLTKPDGELIPSARKSELENDGDIILLDRNLIIYKLAESILKYKTLEYSYISKQYQRRLIYLIEKNVGNKPRIDIRGNY